MTKTHEKIVNEIVDKYKKKESTVAITLFGSLARNEEREDSDVDIEIISENEKEWKLLKDKKYGIDIDLVICPKKHLLYQVKKYPYLCYDYLDEKIIYDPDKFILEIKSELELYFDKHPEVVSFWKEKHKIMKENKAKEQDPKNAVKTYDDAEILFSKEHRITRNFFRE